MDGDTIIGDGMIIDQIMVVKLGLISNFKHNTLKLYCNVVPMNQLDSQKLGPGKTNITRHYIHYFVIQTSEPASTK